MHPQQHHRAYQQSQFNHMMSPQFQQESSQSDNNYAYMPGYPPHPYQQQHEGLQSDSQVSNSDQKRQELQHQTQPSQPTLQHRMEPAIDEQNPQVQTTISAHNQKWSHRDQQMGANELESSPEVRSTYLKGSVEGRPSEEPRTASRHPSAAGLLDGDIRTSSAAQSSSQLRPAQIDQSSIIKNQDESAFNNNLHIFPNGAPNPAAHANHSGQPVSATFPTVTQFQKESLENQANDQKRSYGRLADAADGNNHTEK